MEPTPLTDRPTLTEAEAQIQVSGKVLIMAAGASPGWGPYAGGPPRRFPLGEVQAIGKLCRYGDALQWTICRLPDGAEVLVVAKEQPEPARRLLNRIMRRWIWPGGCTSREAPWGIFYGKLKPYAQPAKPSGGGAGASPAGKG